MSGAEVEFEEAAVVVVEIGTAVEFAIVAVHVVVVVVVEIM